MSNAKGTYIQNVIAKTKNKTENKRVAMGSSTSTHIIPTIKNLKI